MTTAPLWEMFKGRSNTDDLLREKAAVIARLIAGDFDSAETLASQMSFPFEKVQAALAKAETGALWLHIIDRYYAFKLLSPTQRDLFMSVLEEDIIEKLRPFGIGRAIFVELLQERYAEYPAYKLAPVNEQGGTNGTLLREFDKKVAAILEIGERATFNTCHANLLLRQLVRWELRTLIGG